MNKINWGILSTAKIGVNKVIPARLVPPVHFTDGD
jgi:hypothetical protein